MGDLKKSKYMVDWSGLLPDLLALIATRISMVEDFMAFRGVCTSWRASASMDKFVANSWPTAPLLMFCEKEDSSDDYKFYSLYKNKICMRLSIPEAKGKNCMASTGGWLITVGESGEMSLLNPFTRSQIQLPNQKTFPDYEKYSAMTDYPQINFLERAVLSACPSDTPDFVLVVIHSENHFLGFWKPGDECWNRVENSLVDPNGENDPYPYSDVNYYNGRFYGITSGGHLLVLSPDLTTAQCIFRVGGGWLDQPYLVESSSGELIVVTRVGYVFRETHFSLIKVDIKNCSWKEITSLGTNAIFVGHNTAFSIDANTFPSSSSIKPNCIYFGDDFLEAFIVENQINPRKVYGKDNGIYHLKDRKIEKFDDVHALTLRNAPVWVPC